MLRVIRELRPAWVIGENVPQIVNLALDTVLSDLEGEGYEVQCFLVPACGVDAPHKRERVAILAHALDRGGSVCRDGELQDVTGNVQTGSHNGRRAAATLSGERREDEPGASGVADGLRKEVHTTDSNALRLGVQGRIDEQGVFTDRSCRERERETDWVSRSSLRTRRTHSAWEDWPDEPGIPRVVDGLSHRVDRIRCLGNAVVPQQFYPFFRAIYIVETSNTGDVWEYL